MSSILNDSDLVSRDPKVRKKAACKVRISLEIALKDQPVEELTKLFTNLTTEIFHYINSTDIYDRLGGLTIIDSILDILRNDIPTLVRFALYNRLAINAVSTASSEELIEMSCQIDGSQIADFLEKEVDCALEWLNNEHQSNRHLLALTMIKQLARNSPIIFYQKMEKFIDNIWLKLKSDKYHIRIAAYRALKEALKLLYQKESSDKLRWYEKLYSNISEYMSNNNNNNNNGMILNNNNNNNINDLSKVNADEVHGMLLIITSLIKAGDKFARDHCSEMMKFSLECKDIKDKYIRSSVIKLAHIFAKFDQNNFISLNNNYSSWMVLLQGALTDSSEKALAFVSIGKLATALQDKFDPSYISPIMKHIVTTLTSKKRSSPQALRCVALLAQSVEPLNKKSIQDLKHNQTYESFQKLQLTLYEAIKSILDPMFNLHISPALINTLTEVCKNIPRLCPYIQERLIHELSLVLSGKPYYKSSITKSDRLVDSYLLPCNIIQEDITTYDINTIKLALDSLTSIDWGNINLLPMLKESVVIYLDHHISSIRKSAALACCELLLPKNVNNNIYFNVEYESNTEVQNAKYLIEDILQRLLIMCITDRSAELRYKILLCLDSRYDEFLQESENINYIFKAIGDEEFKNELVACEILGRLVKYNPSAIAPYIRQIDAEILNKVEYWEDGLAKDEAIQLLSHLVKIAPSLFEPYSLSTYSALFPRLQATSHVGVASAILSTLGELIRVNPSELSQYYKDIIPILLNCLQEDVPAPKKKAALFVLEEFTKDENMVIDPYITFPQLLPLLLNLLGSSQLDGETREQTMKTIGRLGALDPYQYKSILSTLNEKSNPINDNVNSKSITPIKDSMTSQSDSYIISTTITSLIKMLKEKKDDPQDVIQKITSIVTILKAQIVPYLNIILNPLLSLIPSCSHVCREMIIQQLPTIILIVEDKITEYLPEVFELVYNYWDKNLSSLLILVEHIYTVCKSEFILYVPKLVTLMLKALNSDKSNDKEGTMKILNTLQYLSPCLTEFSHIVMPSLLKMMENNQNTSNSTLLSLQKKILTTINLLCQSMKNVDYAPKVINPLLRTLEQSTDSVIRSEILEILCSLVYLLKEDYIIYCPTVNNVLYNLKIGYSKYVDLLTTLMNGLPLPPMEIIRPPEHTLKYDESNHNLKFSSDEVVKSFNIDNVIDDRDWMEWIRKLSYSLIKCSPSVVIRTCHNLAVVYIPLQKELFNIAFLSCWDELLLDAQDEVVESLKRIINKSSVPLEILNMILNLLEFMELQERALPIEPSQIGELALKCNAYAKALHFLEIQFTRVPSSCIEELISIYNQLGQPEAAEGILNYAKGTKIKVEELWYEKLGLWDEALKIYEEKQLLNDNRLNSISAGGAGDISNDEAIVNEDLKIVYGRLRCLYAIGEYEKVLNLVNIRWKQLSNQFKNNNKNSNINDDNISRHNHSEELKTTLIGMLFDAAWNLGNYDEMRKISDEFAEHKTKKDFNLKDYGGNDNSNSGGSGNIGNSNSGIGGSGIGGSSSSGGSSNSGGSGNDRMESVSADDAFMQTVLSIHNENFNKAKDYIHQCREYLHSTLSTLIHEGYNRCYLELVKLQHLSEMEEIIEYKSHIGNDENKLRCIWNKRLSGCEKNINVWNKILLVRSLVLKKSDNLESWLKFSTLCRKQSHKELSSNVLYDLGINRLPDSSLQPVIIYSYCKFLWNSNGENNDKENAFRKISELCENDSIKNGELKHLSVKIFTTYSEWLLARNDHKMSKDILDKMLNALNKAIEFDNKNSKSWHQLALTYFMYIKKIEETELNNCNSNNKIENMMDENTKKIIVNAVNSFFKAILYAKDLHGSNLIQDILRILTLLFRYGHIDEINHSLNEGINQISIDTWLDVIPQLIARLNITNKSTSKLLVDILSKLGESHPQSLIYSLTVSVSSDSENKQRNGQKILSKMKEKYPELVEEATMVSSELMRVAILWSEMWFEGLEDASRAFFIQNDIKEMINILENLHTMMKKGAVTMKEISFEQSLGRELDEAHQWLLKYKSDENNKSHLDSAWSIYYEVFKIIRSQINLLHSVNLEYASPKLLSAKNLELVLPGNYKVKSENICIAGFQPKLTVIPSKQRPRKIIIIGSDGINYPYLLKGHEDLRQDERVMQLFGLVNQLLKSDSECNSRNLSIRRYVACPLSNNAGLIGWVENHNTIHGIIKEYRESHRILINVEQKLIYQLCPNFDDMTIIGKVEAFDYALEKTRGQDLNKMFWLKSGNSESWLERRTNFTRSMGIMSMVGYMLGLGDRHPSNIMLDNDTGKICHIDFGDCFEVAMMRDHFPETIPFRLTRMLINAMEVRGIEGSFRYTCVSVMSVLRENDNKESLMALLEAFVHDPLVSWRLLSDENNENNNKDTNTNANNTNSKSKNEDNENGNNENLILDVEREDDDDEENENSEENKIIKSRSSLNNNNSINNNNNGDDDVSNEKALAIINRINDKLTGKDFIEDSLNVNDQVQKLIRMATDHVNLCQLYIGWCPFW